MLKKLLTATAICLGFVSNASAVSLYFGAGGEFDNSGAGDASYSGYAPRAILGFGANFLDPFHIAGEVFVYEDVIDQYNDLDKNYYSVRTRLSYGASALPGFSFDPNTIGFVRLGVIETRFTDLNAWRTGFQGGVGAQMTFYNCWTLRAEYDYTRYRDLAYLNGNLHSSTYLVSFLYDINF